MINLIIASLYFILPSYFANMCPVIFKWMPFGRPISKKLFGDHKTYRGIYTSYFGALIILFLQYYFQKQEIFSSYNLLNYEKINLFLYAFLFGIGSALGDAIKSFFKRRINIAPGRPWLIFDQLDFILGSLVFLKFAFIISGQEFILSWQNILAILIITPLLHFLANITAYALRIKKVWW